jgi:hypothetical protein
MSKLRPEMARGDLYNAFTDDVAATNRFIELRSIWILSLRNGIWSSKKIRATESRRWQSQSMNPNLVFSQGCALDTATSVSPAEVLVLARNNPRGYF